jgi:hypothetical protein
MEVTDEFSGHLLLSQKTIKNGVAIGDIVFSRIPNPDIGGTCAGTGRITTGRAGNKSSFSGYGSAGDG